MEEETQTNQNESRNKFDTHPINKKSSSIDSKILIDPFGIKKKLLYKRKYLLKITPIEARNLLEPENGKIRLPYCTLVLLDEFKKEIKGEKQRTSILRDCNPVWSPLKCEILRLNENPIQNYQSLGLAAAAASEEYTFGICSNIINAKYILIKCKDKGIVDNEDLGRLILNLDELDGTGNEKIEWYPLKNIISKRKNKLSHSSSLSNNELDNNKDSIFIHSSKIYGDIRIATRITREPNRCQLWLCANHMMKEIDIKDRSFYLKLHLLCFTGKDALDWFLCHGPNRPTDGNITISTEEEGILIGNCMIRAGIISHVTGKIDKNRFLNHPRQYYRFTIQNDQDIILKNKAINEMNYILSQEYKEEEIDYSDWFHNKKDKKEVDNNVEISTNDTFISLINHNDNNDIIYNDNKKKKDLFISNTLKITDFQLLKVLGTGHYGKVLSAKGPNNKIYAIKIISKIGINDDLRRNIKMERDILKEVRHPFIATLEFAFQNEDKLYMGMEFFSGGNLRHHLDNHYKLGSNYMTNKRILLYAAELVAAIAHLHSLDIIYCDLKPDNILIAKDGHLCLVDFIRSKKGIHSIEEINTLTGSIDYIAPEILAMSNIEEIKHTNTTFISNGYNSTCDWWSLGILIFEMFVGRTPFLDLNISIMYRNIFEGILHIPSDLPLDVQSLLKGLIVKDPSKRLGIGEIVPFSIMNHEYFKDIDWDHLQKKEIQPEWIPEIINETDANYINEEYILQKATDTPEWRMLDSVDREREYLKDFTYKTEEIIKFR